MLNPTEVDRIAGKAATTVLTGVELRKVYGEPAVDSDGREALHITIVFRNVGRNRITGDTALDVIVRIQHDLTEAGEERFPIVEFMTEEEMALNAST